MSCLGSGSIGRILGIMVVGIATVSEGSNTKEACNKFVTERRRGIGLQGTPVGIGEKLRDVVQIISIG